MNPLLRMAGPLAQEPADSLLPPDLLSEALSFSLGRQYLDAPLERVDCLQAISVNGQGPLFSPVFSRVEQVGQVAGGPTQPLIALQTALAACHNPGRHTLLFFVRGDGLTNQIYLGVRPHESSEAGGPSEAFMRQLGHFVRSAWPGTRLVLADYEQDVRPHLAAPAFTAALTGIPALKSGDQGGYPQSLDRLLRGLRGQPFGYLVVAEPMSEALTSSITRKARDLIAQVHLLSRLSVTGTHGEGSTITDSQNLSEGDQIAEQSGGNSSEARQGEVTFKQVFKDLFSTSAFLSAVTGQQIRRSASTGTSWSTTRSTSRGTSIGVSASANTSKSEATALEIINAHAQAAEHLLNAYVERFEQGRGLGNWRVSAFFTAAEAATVQQGSSQVRALLSGNRSTLEPMRAHDVGSRWSAETRRALAAFQALPLDLVNPLDYGKRLSHPLGAAFERLETPLNTEELSLLINFPRRETPGVRMVTSADFSLNSFGGVQRAAGCEPAIDLGYLLEGGEPTQLPARIPMDDLAKHVLLVGTTGSGKSTTCRRMLTALQREGKPFLVIEPAKTEYVEWAHTVNAALPPGDARRITVYMPGAALSRGPITPLHLNPLDVMWLSQVNAPQVLPHIDRLKSILTAAFPMQESLPVLLEDALFDTYLKLGWLDDTLTDSSKVPPTLTDLLNRVPDVVRGKGYDASVTANLTAALTTRIQSLRRGWKQQLFDRPRSTPWTDLFDRPAVINLSQLGDDGDKALAMAVLMLFLVEYRQANHELERPSGARGLRHLTVIEEAHRILQRPSHTGIEAANPQAKIADMFAQALSEIRAYGQGIMIADQVPGRLIPDAVKNTNLKIVHKLIDEGDRAAMASCMMLTPDQQAVVSRLSEGQAIVFGDRDEMASWVKVEKS